LDDNHLGTKGARLIGAALESQSNCKLKRLGFVTRAHSSILRPWTLEPSASALAFLICALPEAPWHPVPPLPLARSVQNNGLDDAAKKLLKDAEEGGRIHHQVGRRYTFASPPPLHQ